MQEANPWFLIIIFKLTSFCFSFTLQIELIDFKIICVGELHYLRVMETIDIRGKWLGVGGARL